MDVQGALWLAKRYPSTLISVFLTSRGWVDPVPDPILLEKFLGYSRVSNPGPLRRQSDVLTTIPNRWSEIKLGDPKESLAVGPKISYTIPADIESVGAKELVKVNNNFITRCEALNGGQFQH